MTRAEALDLLWWVGLNLLAAPLGVLAGVCRAWGVTPWRKP